MCLSVLSCALLAKWLTQSPAEVPGTEHKHQATLGAWRCSSDDKVHTPRALQSSDPSVALPSLAVPPPHASWWPRWAARHTRDPTAPLSCSAPRGAFPSAGAAVAVHTPASGGVCPCRAGRDQVTQERCQGAALGGPSLGAVQAPPDPARPRSALRFSPPRFTRPPQKGPRANLRLPASRRPLRWGAPSRDRGQAHTCSTGHAWPDVFDERQ